MNQLFFRFALPFIVITIALSSCSSAPDKNENDNKSNDTKNVKEEKSLPQEVKKVSKTKDEVLSLVKDYIKKNKRKLSIEGEIQEYLCVSGDYSGDELNDFFVTVVYYPGGDFLYREYFFYSSEKEEVNVLKIGKTLDKSVHENINSINVKRIEKGKIVGKAFLMMAFNVEEDFTADVPCTFTIENNKILIDKTHSKAFNRANKRILTQFQERQAELESIQDMEQEETSTE
jgi:hypothetical protein